MRVERSIWPKDTCTNSEFHSEGATFERDPRGIFTLPPPISTVALDNGDKRSRCVSIVLHSASSPTGMNTIFERFYRTGLRAALVNIEIVYKVATRVHAPVFIYRDFMKGVMKPLKAVVFNDGDRS